ncbi:MAG: hypothetical protein R2747_13585 [Pyrinomonadaceae bacterium]
MYSSAIYITLLDLLADPRIYSCATGRSLPGVFRHETKGKIPNAVQIETEIFHQVEFGFFPDWEVRRTIPIELYRRLKKQGRADLTFDGRIVPAPNWILNALVCTELEKRFGRKTLLACEGFVEIHARNPEGSGQISAVRIDIEDHFSKRGFLMPVLRNGMAVGLRVFRHPGDERPFLLRSRRKSVLKEVSWQ